MAKKFPKISEAEWEVMKVIWDQPPMTAGEIVERLSYQKDWNHRTIKTLLSRLVKKGALVYEAEGNRYLYQAKIRKEDIIRRESQSFLNRVFDGVTVPMLAHFVKTAKMSPDEIQQLKQILAEKEGKNGHAPRA
jgi:BlaI family penicillinase repressor